MTSGTLSPCLEVGIGMAYVAAELAEPGTEIEIDVRGKRRPARIESKPLYTKGELTLAERATRRSSGTTPSTTGPGSRATRRRSAITWYAQDALGEVVFYEPPEVGSQATQGPGLCRGGVGEGGLRRLRAALRRDHRPSTRRSRDSPELINEDPYGEGWLVRVKLTDPSEVDAAARRWRPTASCSRTS